MRAITKVSTLFIILNSAFLILNYISIPPSNRAVMFAITSAEV